MGWNLRRSVNLGPLRVNLSKSGVGYSIGGRGFRVGKDAHGRKYRSLSIPKTGIYRRDYFPSSTTPVPTSAPAVAANSSLAQANPTGAPRVGAGASWAYYLCGAVALYAVIRLLF